MTDNQNDTGGQDNGMSGAGEAGQPGTFTGGSGGQAGNTGAGQSGTGQSGMGQPDTGYGDESGQQRQLDQSGSGQMGSGMGSGDTSRFADQIREHMQVIDADGNEVGIVDSCEDGQIKLTRESSENGHHRWLEMNEVESIDGDQVRLRADGNSEGTAGFGQGV